MKIGLKAVALVFAAALSGCGAPSPEKIAEASFTFSETNRPVQLFSDVCLKTLPSFDTFLNAVQKQGLEPSTPIGGHDAYMASGDKFLVATVFDEDDMSACAVAFLGSANSKQIGELFLQEASKRTGGKPQKQFPSGRYNYAYQLKNGSLLVYEVKKPSGQVRHFVFVTKPISRKEVASYIYN
ncbi:hypothetical protein [uncultured Ruegeria sp.]|uniref:hypothetical protein n=1 Tax=uncultured Ruegeria sp. TaxID=259304 RepID=UPI0026223137|nr:hypothetical protein [uncultured Ruegeria sp.]